MSRKVLTQSYLSAQELLVKVLNNTLHKEGLVHLQLLLRAISQPFTTFERNTERFTVDETAAIAFVSGKEMSNIMTRKLLNGASKRAVAGSSFHTYSTGDQVLDWREDAIDSKIGD